MIQSGCMNGLLRREPQHDGLCAMHGASQNLFPSRAMFGLTGTRCEVKQVFSPLPG